MYEGLTGPKLDSQYIYKTTIPGVGIRLSFGENKVIPFFSIRSSGWDITSNIEMVIEFIRLGPITAAGTLEGEIAGGFAENGATQVISIRLANPITVTPKTPTCSATMPTIEVDMGKVAVSSFGGAVGSYGGNPTDFNIDLLCDGGESTSYTNLHMTLTDATDPGNTSDQLNLTPDSTAEGVKLRIFNGSEAVSFGPDSDVTGNLNQWSVGQVQNGPVSIPLSVRYVKTDPVVRPGSVQATATFTLNYQ